MQNEPKSADQRPAHQGRSGEYDSPEAAAKDTKTPGRKGVVQVASEDSFPASDPPGWVSVSPEDTDQPSEEPRPAHEDPPPARGEQDRG